MEGSMKRFLLSLGLVAAICCTSSAQTSAQILDYFKTMKSAVIEFTMSGTGLDGSKISSQTGVMDLQYPYFKIVSNGQQVSCDGKAMWVYNPATEELVITSSLLGQLLSDASMTVGDNGKPVFTFSNKNGSKMTFRMDRMTPSDPWASSHFIIDEKTLGDDVVVTDLR